LSVEGSAPAPSAEAPATTTAATASAASATTTTAASNAARARAAECGPATTGSASAATTETAPTAGTTRSGAGCSEAETAVDGIGAETAEAQTVIGQAGGHAGWQSDGVGNSLSGRDAAATARTAAAGHHLLAPGFVVEGLRQSAAGAAVDQKGVIRLVAKIGSGGRSRGRVRRRLSIRAGDCLLAFRSRPNRGALKRRLWWALSGLGGATASRGRLTVLSRLTVLPRLTAAAAPEAATTAAAGEAAPTTARKAAAAPTTAAPAGLTWDSGQ
jgi:hypothetical protein